MNIEYALIVDVSTQWFAYIVEYKDTKFGKEEISYHQIPNGMDNNNPFLDNIYSRKLSFLYERFNISSQDYFGWHLSPLEYNRIKRMIDIWPRVLEFEKLKSYE